VWPLRGEDERVTAGEDGVGEEEGGVVCTPTPLGASRDSRSEGDGLAGMGGERGGV
jgi:hypothetical protein